MNFKCTVPGFLNFATTDSGQINLYIGTCQMHFRKFRIIPGLYPQDASRVLTVVTRKNVSRLCQPLHYTMWKKPDSAEWETIMPGKNPGLPRTGLEVKLEGWEFFGERKCLRIQWWGFGYCYMNRKACCTL